MCVCVHGSLYAPTEGGRERERETEKERERERERREREGERVSTLV